MRRSLARVLNRHNVRMSRREHGLRLFEISRYVPAEVGFLDFLGRELTAQLAIMCQEDFRVHASPDTYLALTVIMDFADYLHRTLSRLATRTKLPELRL